MNNAPIMDTTATPVAAPEIPWKITGRITPAPVGLSYKLGAMLNAIAMLLLPGLYLGMVGGLGWFIYSRITSAGPAGQPGSSDSDVWYFFLMIVGAITLLFMIKPIFARRPKRPPALEITRAEQPRLFAFIDAICAQVRAPRPRHVFVDLQINASASFSRSFGSLLRRDLTLSVGLPLVAGLSARDFGGVLAHEFGHFAQGAAMRITYVIRSTNAWFARVVYERDGLDDFLRVASMRIIGLILCVARILIWLARKILWVLMWLGNALSCFMLRQMEMDADYYETQVAGSESFARTMATLRLLGAGWRRSVAIQQESYAAGRLVDDIPRFVALEAQRLPAEARDAIMKEAAEPKTGWFNTHPSDMERMRAAEDAKAAGVLAGEGPAADLFDDFSSVARQVTLVYYQGDENINLKGAQLVPLDTVANERSAREETEKATKDFFHGLLTIRTMLILSPGELRRTPRLEDLTADWRDAQRRQLAALPGTEKLIGEMIEADGKDLAMAQAKAILQAGFKVKDGQFGLAKPSWQTVSDFQDEARRKITQRRDGLVAAHTATRDRFVAALRTYFLEPLPCGLSPEAPAEIERLVRIISRFDASTDALVSLRNQAAAFELLMANMPKEGVSTYYTTAREIGSSMIRVTDRLLEAAAGLEYPFDHARGKVLLSKFLVETPTRSDESIHAFQRARALIDRFFALYDRINGRLTQLGLEAEQKVLSAVPQPGEAIPMARFIG